tara:strand:+ start:540499 stop:541605 length:1107 start_codon:yes stop_codon:yes gene_type:complete
MYRNYSLISIAAISSAPLFAHAGPVDEPVIHEDGWVQEASIDFVNPVSALINPADGLIYLGRRTGNIYRMDYAAKSELIVFSSEVAGIAYDPIDEGLFFSEDFPGRIYRVDIDNMSGAVSSQLWVSGFHSGDDDPVGIGLVPMNYSGGLFSPGTMVSTDRGFNGPNGIWSWSPVVAEGEVLTHNDDSMLVDPVDIAVNSQLIMIADSTNGVQVLNDDNSISNLITNGVVFADAQGVVFDTRSDDLFVLDVDLDAIYRVDVDSGNTTLIVDHLGTELSNWGGINIDDDGTTQRLIVSSMGNDQVYIFSNTPPCSNADLSGPFGVLNFFDVSAFLTAFNSMDPIADFSTDGQFNFFDVSAFLQAFNAGCP